MKTYFYIILCSYFDWIPYVQPRLSRACAFCELVGCGASSTAKGQKVLACLLLKS